MIERGLLKARRFTNAKNKRAYLYVLTRKGMERKIMLTRGFLERKMREYEQLKSEIQDLQQAVKEYDAPRPVDEQHPQPPQAYGRNSPNAEQ